MPPSTDGERNAGPRSSVLRTMMHRLISITALAGLLLSACGVGGPSPELDGEWVLANGTVDGTHLQQVVGTQVTLRIDGSTVGGIAACNHYGGEVERQGAGISFSAMTMTEMGCNEPVMALEAAYVAALARVDTAARDGDRLRLSGPGVDLDFTLVPPIADVDPVDTNWALQSLIVGDTASSVMGDATLRLAADGTLSGFTGCRGFGATYAVDGDALKVDNMFTDRRGCDPGLDGQDRHVIEVLEQSPTIVVSGDRLTLMAGARGLDYRAAP